MLMTIGEKIKKLRREQDITQEKLAEYLKISSQSVSKWETGNGMPDIALIVPIANFFGVSLDELFDRDAEGESEAVEAILEESHRLRFGGFIIENLELWRDAASEYPRNYRFMYELARALWDTTNSFDGDEGYPFEKVSENSYEAIRLCGRILEDCTDNEIRTDAITLIVYLYSDPDLPCADEEKAVIYANMAGSMYSSREILLEEAYFTEENKHKATEQKHKNTLSHIDSAARNIMYGDRKNNDPEEELFALQSALALWKTVIYDDNFLFFHCRITKIYEYMAYEYAKLGDRDNTIESLRLAMKHAKASDNVPEGVSRYTSVLVSEATEDPGTFTKNYTDTTVDILKMRMGYKGFDFVRDDPEFLEILNS